MDEKKKKLRRARVESREKGYVKLFFNKKKNWKKFDFEIYNGIFIVVFSNESCGNMRARVERELKIF